MTPVTVDDLAANGLLGEAVSRVRWERSVETLTARKDEIAGLAVASDERIEASVLYVQCEGDAEIVSLRSSSRRGDRLKQLIPDFAREACRRSASQGAPGRILQEYLETLGFRLAGAHRLYAARARSD